jgi:RNA polymerase sigma-19 factor, ECF subfamily
LPAPTPPPDEHTILDGLRAGRQDAFETIFRTYYAQMVGLAESILSERAPAEDAAQDVMLELWRRRESIVPETSLRAYLLRATRNRALNQIRHQRVARAVDPEVLPPLATPAADRDVLHQEMEGALKEAIAALPERCREVFELSRVHGLKYAEIAQTLDISVKTVEAQMGKAIRVLRQRLAPWLPEGGDV